MGIVKPGEHSEIGLEEPAGAQAAGQGEIEFMLVGMALFLAVADPDVEEQILDVFKLLPGAFVKSGGLQNVAPDMIDVASPELHVSEGHGIVPDILRKTL